MSCKNWRRNCFHQSCHLFFYAKNCFFDYFYWFCFWFHWTTTCNAQQKWNMNYRRIWQIKKNPAGTQKDTNSPRAIRLKPTTSTLIKWAMITPLIKSALITMHKSSSVPFPQGETISCQKTNYYQTIAPGKYIEGFGFTSGQTHWIVHENGKTMRCETALLSWCVGNCCACCACCACALAWNCSRLLEASSKELTIMLRKRLISSPIFALDANWKCIETNPCTCFLGIAMEYKHIITIITIGHNRTTPWATLEEPVWDLSSKTIHPYFHLIYKQVLNLVMVWHARSRFLRETLTRSLKALLSSNTPSMHAIPAEKGNVQVDINNQAIHSRYSRRTHTHPTPGVVRRNAYYISLSFCAICFPLEAETALFQASDVKLFNKPFHIWSSVFSIGNQDRPHESSRLCILLSHVDKGSSRMSGRYWMFWTSLPHSQKPLPPAVAESIKIGPLTRSVASGSTNGNLTKIALLGAAQLATMWWQGDFSSLEYRSASPSDAVFYLHLPTVKGSHRFLLSDYKYSSGKTFKLCPVKLSCLIQQPLCLWICIDMQNLPKRQGLLVDRSCNRLFLYLKIFIHSSTRECYMHFSAHYSPSILS